MEYLPREWAPPSRSRAAEGWAEARSACRIQAVARGFLLRRSLAWCPICLCRTDEPVTFASCEHVLCRSCSHACARRAMRSCPLCRAPCKWDLPPAQRLRAPPSEASGDSSSRASSPRSSSTSDDGDELSRSARLRLYSLARATISESRLVGVGAWAPYARHRQRAPMGAAFPSFAPRSPYREAERGSTLQRPRAPVAARPVRGVGLAGEHSASTEAPPALPPRRFFDVKLLWGQLQLRAARATALDNVAAGGHARRERLHMRRGAVVSIPDGPWHT